MSTDSGERRLFAQWAVLGKRPGEVMGYEVLAGSLPRERAASYLLGSVTANPEGEHPGAPDALPWRVFLSAVEGEPSTVSARVETRWDGIRDGTGRPSYSSYLTLLDWVTVSRTGLTWTALDRAVEAADWTVVDATGSGAGSRPELPLDARRTTVLELAETVDELGFDWSSGVAALLLDGRQVVITLPYGAEPPDVNRRVLILDAVCALLPYGCRVWLSAATWAGHRAEHKLGLVFALRARPSQWEVVLGGPVPREPAGATASTYLHELRRLRLKKGGTAELVSHLLCAAQPLAFSEGDLAVRRLREIDLMDAVLAEIAEGRGDPARVRYVLQRQSAGQDDAKIRQLFLFLAHCSAQRRVPEDAAEARSALLTLWHPQLSDCLAADLSSEPPSKESFGRALEWLRLAQEAEASTPGACGDLLRSVVGAEQPSAGRNWSVWRAQLISAAQQEFGAGAEAADAVLADSREVGLEWLSHTVDNNTLDLRVVDRLARREVQGGGQFAAWPRFLGALVGVLPPSGARPEDARQFAELGDRAWKIAMEIADRFRQVSVLELLWRKLLDVATAVGTDADDDRRLLSDWLKRLVPSGPGLEPEVAATADLLQVAQGSMPRLPELRIDRERYVATLAQRLDSPAALGDLDRKVVRALLGPPDRPPGESAWEALVALTARRQSLRMTVLDAVAERLSGYETGLDLDLPQEWVGELGRRPGLDWLPAQLELRAVVGSSPSAEELSRALVRATRSGPLQARALREVAPWLRDRDPASVDGLARCLDHESPGRRLGMQLYAAVFADGFGNGLRERMRRFGETETARWAQIRSLPGAGSGAPPPPVNRGPSTPPPTVAPGGGPRQTGSPRPADPRPQYPPEAAGRPPSSGVRDVMPVLDQRLGNSDNSPPDAQRGHGRSRMPRFIYKRRGRS
ncbi:hypothetical protein [Streptomyces sp. NPDC001530]|uniref:hypothetical protein n=1 Tax=Streptomyces sp. NPDC001530 TaxID=3364582 RepID=UPI0036CF4E21